MADPGNLRVDLEGRGPLTLRPSDYVTSGGEASIYRPNGAGIIVKIYLDAQKMRRDDMVQKVRLLQPLKTESIMAPEGVVSDTKGEPIGIYMPFVEGVSLPQVFTNVFRGQEHFNDDGAKALVAGMRETVQFAHARNAVLGDGNELNWIAAAIGSAHPEAKAIDVDSWGIGRFATTVIMPSIRDWRSSGSVLTEKTDWFAWAIVTFQIFVGIHPYRGTLAGYGPKDWEKRMKDGASVFAPGIKLNASVRDFNAIPGPLLGWYRAVFASNERTVPPSPFDKGVTVTAQTPRALHATTAATGNLVFEKIFEIIDDPVVKVWSCGAAKTASGIVHDLATKRPIVAMSGGEIVEVTGGWLVAGTNHQYAFLDERSGAAATLPFALRSHKIFRYENRLFLVTDNELVELNLMHVGKPILTVGRRTAILSPKSVTWFDGLGVAEAFGAKFLVLPFGERSCVTIRVKELDGLTPVAARAGSRFATIIALDRSGTYIKTELSFSSDYSSYQTWQGSIDGPELNIAILPKGVCATIINDGELVIFVPSNGKMTRVADKQIVTDMALANWKDTVVYIRDGAVWSLRLK